MATYLARSWSQLRLLRQSLSNVPNHGHIKHDKLQVYTVILAQSQYYHVTSVYDGSAKSKKNAEVKIVLPNPKKQRPTIKIWQSMTVKDLVKETKRDVKSVVEALSRIDTENVYSKNTVISKFIIAQNAAHLLGYKCLVSENPNHENIDEPKISDLVKRPPPPESVLVPRRPIVTIMGHVDHGKTTLLDTLRKSSVVATEFGGITQHIGAFNVTTESGEHVTFLDTPGHAAFSTMRARGANVTDIVVLVVAADDGVMEQTLESINMAKNAKVPIIVAINKIDKPTANIKRTQHMLSEHDILVDELGGNIQSVKISALDGTNLDDLISAIALEAEISNLKGDPTGPAEGVVIESSNHPHRGRLVTALIQRGTLKRGSAIVSGTAWAKVRSMFDDRGNVLLQAGLSDAVQILGWRTLPHIGDEILEAENERHAREIVSYRESQLASKVAMEHKIAADKKYEEYLAKYKVHLETKRLKGFPYTQMEKYIEHKDKNKNCVNIIVKGDVAGSVEAILDAIETYNEHELCELNLVHYGVGRVTETDINFANAFNAIIYAFNVIIPKTLANDIQGTNVSIREFKVIYKLIDDLIEEINKKVPPVPVEEILGEAEVLQQFTFKDGKTRVHIAGCRCNKGLLKRTAKCRLIRRGEVIYEGSIASLKHQKDDVTTVNSVKECGLVMDDSSIFFEMGDSIICYELVDKAREVSWTPF